MPEVSGAESAAIGFNDAITRGDLDGLVRLMTPDHTFTDSAGSVVSGREACREAWAGFFAAFPGYRNVFTAVATSGDVVILAGYSECSEPALAGRALWRATVSGDRVASWAVSEDSAANRDRLGLPRDVGA